MKWQLTQPVAGDMIRVKLGSIYHYGVFVSEEEVIQFGLLDTLRLTCYTLVRNVWLVRWTLPVLYSTTWVFWSCR